MGGITEAPGPWVALLWGLMCHFAMLQLGNFVVKGASLIERLAAGWLFSMGLAYFALATMPKGDLVLVVMGWALALWWFRDVLRSLRHRNWSLDQKALTSLSIGEKALILLALALLLVRIVQSLLPINNWDSLNHHLPILISRLQEGNWDPTVWVSTERRTPLFSILPKLWAVTLDPTGRSLVVQHLFLGVALLLGVSHIIRQRWPQHKLLVPILMVWSLSDIWRHTMSAGDEIWLVLGAMAFLGLYWSKELRGRALFLGSVVPLACIGVKATAIFFILPFGLAWLVLLRKKPGSIAILFSLGLGLVVLSLAPNLSNYSLAYPANRWSDLLATHSPEVLSISAVKEERLALGLEDHRDNRPPGAKAINSLKENLTRLPSLALGPYLIWLLVGLVLYGENLRRRILEPDGIALGMALLAVTLSLVSWSFSPQAMFRYLLPVWWVMLISSGILLHGLYPRRWVTSGIGVVLLFGLGLEGREIIKGLKAPHAWSPTEHWLQKNADGPLIKAWRDLSQNEGKAFYIGSLSVMMTDQNRHWLAQLGNEVGWRRPKDLEPFLNREKIHWWILSAQADRLDPLYRTLTESLVRSGHLKKVETLDSGEIYQTSLSSD